MRINPLFVMFVIMVGFVFIAVSDQAESSNIRGTVAGSIKQVGAHYIRVSDDYNGGEVRIKIDHHTQFDNVRRSTDLEEGDNVQVEYNTVHNKNTAITITKIPMESEDVL